MAYVIGVDLGSTTLTCKIYNKDGNSISFASEKVPYLYLTHGAVEIDPDDLWDLFLKVVKEAIKKSCLEPNAFQCIGISCQRSTIILWDRKTGSSYCNFISWQDTRCAGVTISYNQSWMLKGINMIGFFLYTLCRHKMFLLMKVLKFKVNSGSMKLAWLLEVNPKLKEMLTEGKLSFGSIDTWFIWKLSKGKLYVTDPTNAIGTGLWNPFSNDWELRLFGLPNSVMPSVMETSQFFCKIDYDVFGSSLSLNSVVSDVAAASFAQCCFNMGEISCIMGTGCFLSINCGSYLQASMTGLYPQVAWKINNEYKYTCEAMVSGIASSIEWAKNIGLFDDVSKTSEIAFSVNDSGGVYFVPGFYGLSLPYNDPYSCGGFIGISNHTTKSHMVRAILESIAFRLYETYQLALGESTFTFKDVIKVCGGVSNNNFILQLMSSLTGCVIERSSDSEMSVLGAVYLAGLSHGVWKNKEEIKNMSQPSSVFVPDIKIQSCYSKTYITWVKAVKRCMNWYHS
ncbi:putative glycerol kinase 5 isoform X1 [Hydra vulgaris]|uniref:putative glycerol kinase 5 isoform X1 n=1 Tax=Hydra vulgaris TaxID=6087 RepID=UPI001F5E7E82|nr:putative glycerol kinase 5 isoform X1 [Hydra vulgaris]